MADQKVCRYIKEDEGSWIKPERSPIFSVHFMRQASGLYSGAGVVNAEG